MAEVVIDLNARTHHNHTFASLARVRGQVMPGSSVTVVEPESELVGTAVVAKIDASKGLIILDVDWASLHAGTVAEEVPVTDTSFVRTGGAFPVRVDKVFGQSVHLEGGGYLLTPQPFSDSKIGLPGSINRQQKVLVG